MRTKRIWSASVKNFWNVQIGSKTLKLLLEPLTLRLANTNQHMAFLTFIVQQCIEHNFYIPELLDALWTFILMSWAWATRQYTFFPEKTLMLALGMLLEVVQPTNIVRNALRKKGYLEQESLFEEFLISFYSDLKRFKLWRFDHTFNPTIHLQSS